MRTRWGGDGGRARPAPAACGEPRCGSDAKRRKRQVPFRRFASAAYVRPTLSAASPPPSVPMVPRPRRRVALPALVLAAGTLAAQALTAQALAAQAPSAPPANRANWTLANRFSPQSLRSTLYTNGVTPRWLGKSDTLWYNWRDRTGSRFWLVVPTATGTATKRPLFDRELLAARLSETSRRPIDPNNLPFTTLTFLKDHRSFRFTVDSTRYEWSLATQTLRSLGRPPRGDAPADEEREVGRTNTGGGGGAGGRGRDFRNWAPDSSAFAFAQSAQPVRRRREDEATRRRSRRRRARLLVRLPRHDREPPAARPTRAERRAAGRRRRGRSGRRRRREFARPARAPERDVVARLEGVLDRATGPAQGRSELYLVNVLAEPRPVLLHYRYAMPGEENVAQSELWVYRRGERAAKQLAVGR